MVIDAIKDLERAISPNGNGARLDRANRYVLSGGVGVPILAQLVGSLVRASEGIEPAEARNFDIAAALILFLGGLMVVLQEILARERDRHGTLHAKNEKIGIDLETKSQELEDAELRVKRVENELSALNGMVQRELDKMFGESDRTQSGPL